VAVVKVMKVFSSAVNAKSHVIAVDSLQMQHIARPVTTWDECHRY
jgi:hypothetical protein